MLTGDAVAIAKETCKQLQLGTNVYDSQRLIGSSMSGSDVRDFVEAAGKSPCALLSHLG
jgi:H+-transporting ATPase